MLQRHFDRWHHQRQSSQSHQHESSSTNSNNNLSPSNLSLEESIPMYKFRIEAIFDHESAREAFRLYLQQSLNEEPFLFYEAVEKYQKTRLDKNRANMANEIMSSFINVNSKYELNLSMTIRNEIMKNWKQISEQNELKIMSQSSGKMNNGAMDDLISCPVDLFSKAQDVIFTELKDDNFPRFVNSENFKKFVKKEMKKLKCNDPKQVLDQLGSMKVVVTSGSSSSNLSNNNNNNPIGQSNEQERSSSSSSSSHSLHASSSNLSDRSSTSSSSDDGDNVEIDMGAVEIKLKETKITDRPLIDNTSLYVNSKDYAIVKELITSISDSSRWKTIEEKIGMKTLHSSNNYYLNRTDGALPLVCCSGLVSGKHMEFFDCFLSKSMEEMVSKVCKRRLQLDHIKHDSENNIDYSNTVVYMEIDSHFPFSKREAVVARTIIPDMYNKETDSFDRLVFIQKPSAHEEAVVMKDTIRISIYTAFVVERKTNDTLKYYTFDWLDLKGKVPKKLQAEFAKIGATIMHKMLHKMVKKENAKDKESRVVVSAEGSLEVMNENMKFLKEKLNSKE
ncbi:hypothetical protein C9374_002439 [Naegleria lovaniensis]|uniref:RGS domain-containing protein n=1 Tax=Naegleria lovaniensis TaxID=51637 RepID=A0AA88KKE5_NAELO|nr:uncharacterized protein C9374_002439 [Naegleria lovaniensis]KAG2386695.1 hypothetical protein C9374_002439 [Naegleria lovaniensis]